MTSSVKAALHDARRALADLYQERLVRIVLYGSQVRGTAAPESDVDLLVVLRGDVEPIQELNRLVPLRLRLLFEYGEDITMQPFEESVYENRRHPLMMNVHAEGIEL